MAEKRWFPIESNPIVMNSFVQKLGMDTSSFSFCDVMSTEDWALDMIQDPVLAVLFLFPMKESQPGFLGGTGAVSTATGEGEVYFTKQIVDNACGTIALLHAIANNKDAVTLAPDSFLDRFIGETIAMTPQQRGDYIGESSEIEVVHVESADEGESNQVDIDNVSNHFVCFVNHHNRIIELDGRQDAPIVVGEMDGSQSFLRAAIAAIRTKYMDPDPEEMGFTMVALARTVADEDE